MSFPDNNKSPSEPVPDGRSVRLQGALRGSYPDPENGWPATMQPSKTEGNLTVNRHNVVNDTCGQFSEPVTLQSYTKSSFVGLSYRAKLVTLAPTVGAVCSGFAGGAAQQFGKKIKHPFQMLRCFFPREIGLSKTT